MNQREQYSFILNVMLPAIEREGLTIKTHYDGELTLTASDAAVTVFINELRSNLINALQRPVVNTASYY